MLGEESLKFALFKKSTVAIHAVVVDKDSLPSTVSPELINQFVDLAALLEHNLDYIDDFSRVEQGLAALAAIVRSPESMFEKLRKKINQQLRQKSFDLATWYQTFLQHLLKWLNQCVTDYHHSQISPLLEAVSIQQSLVTQTTYLLPVLTYEDIVLPSDLDDLQFQLAAGCSRLRSLALECEALRQELVIDQHFLDWISAFREVQQGTNIFAVDVFTSLPALPSEYFNQANPAIVKVYHEQKQASKQRFLQLLEQQIARLDQLIARAMSSIDAGDARQAVVAYHHEIKATIAARLKLTKHYFAPEFKSTLELLDTRYLQLAMVEAQVAACLNHLQVIDDKREQLSLSNCERGHILPTCVFNGLLKQAHDQARGEYQTEADRNKAIVALIAELEQCRVQLSVVELEAQIAMTEGLTPLFSRIFTIWRDLECESERSEVALGKDAALNAFDRQFNEALAQRKAHVNIALKPLKAMDAGEYRLTQTEQHDIDVFNQWIEQLFRSDALTGQGTWQQRLEFLRERDAEVVTKTATSRPPPKPPPIWAKEVRSSMEKLINTLRDLFLTHLFKKQRQHYLEQRKKTVTLLANGFGQFAPAHTFQQEHQNNIKHHPRYMRRIG